MKAKVNGMDESSKAPATQTDLATMPRLSIQAKNIDLDMEEIKKWIAPQGATAKEIYTFGRICQTLGLNPFKKEIHFIKYYDAAASIVVGYTVYIDRGERSGKLNGWHVEMDDDVNPTQATIAIHRKDWSEPFRWTVYRQEVEKLKKDGTPQSTWASQPRFQLMKCAIAQGFRLAFPSECGELPYTAEEIAPNYGYLPEVPEVGEATVDGASSLGPNDDIEHLHNQYHKRARQLWNNDELRHGWQEQAIGKESTDDWEVVDYQKAITLLDDEISRQATEEEEKTEEPPPEESAQSGDVTYESGIKSLAEIWADNAATIAKFMDNAYDTEAQALMAMRKIGQDESGQELKDLFSRYTDWRDKAVDNFAENPDAEGTEAENPTEPTEPRLIEQSQLNAIKAILPHTGLGKSFRNKRFTEWWQTYMAADATKGLHDLTHEEAETLIEALNKLTPQKGGVVQGKLAL